MPTGWFEYWNNKGLHNSKGILSQTFYMKNKKGAPRGWNTEHVFTFYLIVLPYKHKLKLNGT